MAATAASSTAAEMTVAPPWVLHCLPLPGCSSSAARCGCSSPARASPRPTWRRRSGKPASTPEMWPQFDAYDLRIPFPDGTAWAIDVKDWANPSLLAVRTRALRADPPHDRGVHRRARLPVPGPRGLRASLPPRPRDRSCAAISRSAPTRSSPGSPGANSAGSSGPPRTRPRAAALRRTEGMTMRSSNGWHLTLSRELTDVWPARSRRLPARRDARRRARPLPAGTGNAGPPGQGRVDPLRRLPVRGGVRPCPDGRAAPGDPPGPPLPVDHAPPPRLAHAPGAVPHGAPGAARLPPSRPRRGARTPVTGTSRRAVREVRGPAHIPAGVHPPAHPAGHGGTVPVPGPGPPLLGHLQPGACRRPQAARPRPGGRRRQARARRSP